MLVVMAQIALIVIGTLFGRGCVVEIKIVVKSEGIRLLVARIRRHPAGVVLEEAGLGRAKLVSEVLVVARIQGGQVGELLCVIEIGVPERCFVH